MSVELIGHEAPRAAFADAVASGRLHHAWLLAGPEGVGKASFAERVATDLLAAATTMPGNNTAAMIAAGSHPDYRVLRRLPRDAEKPDQDLARSIGIKQVRELQTMFATHPSMGAARAIVIDAVDDLERSAANALLKSLEEPPTGTVFLLVSHAPGRLLPTIRSRCRLLRFDPLSDRDVAAIVRRDRPDTPDDEMASLVAVAGGSAGRALRFAGLDLAPLDRDLAAIAHHGDGDAAIRLRLAKALGPKGAQARYEAFLDRVPGFIAGQAAARSGAALTTALDAYAAAADLARSSLGLSLLADVTVFELGSIVARLAPVRASR